MMKTTNYILLSIGCLLQPLNAGAQNYVQPSGKPP